MEKSRPTQTQKYRGLGELGFPGDSAGKESVCNAEDPGLIPVLGRSPGEANNYPLQYSCQESSIDSGATWATIHGVTKSQLPLSDFERGEPYFKAMEKVRILF